MLFSALEDLAHQQELQMRRSAVKYLTAKATRFINKQMKDESLDVESQVGAAIESAPLVIEQIIRSRRKRLGILSLNELRSLRRAGSFCGVKPWC
jgi:hypothetical protein